jgi:hypothetical protein
MPEHHPSAASQQPAFVGPRDGDSEIHPQIRRAQEAFRRDLPELLRNQKLYRQWVAYRGDERVGIARAGEELYEECERRGYREDEYVVRCIVPELPPGTDSTPASEV